MVSHIHTQVITGIPDNDDLPRSLHALADRWRAEYERLDDLEVEAQRLEVIGIGAAQRADEEALDTAITSGSTLPDGDEHERAARRDLAVAERRYAALERTTADTGRELAAAIRAHRKDLAKIHKPRIESALAEYERTVSRARTAIATAATALGEAAAIGDLLADLDLRADRAEPSPLNIETSLDTTLTKRTVLDVIDLLDKPLDSGLIDIVGSNGLRQTVTREVAEQLVESANTDAHYA